MNILDNVKAFEFDKNKEKAFRLKSAVVWGNTDRGYFPLFYVSKPRHMKREDFEYLLDRIDITIRK